MMCRTTYLETERGDLIPQGFQCDSAGDLPCCQLCRRSPTYWRDTPTPAPVPFVIPDLDMTGWIEDRTPLVKDQKDPGYVLPAYLIEDMRCVLCPLPTTWTSPKGTRCHPSCAQMYLRTKARQEALAAHGMTTPASPTAQP